MKKVLVLVQTSRLSPNKEVILAAKVFDTGSGVVRVFDCETLANEPEKLENAAYMIVVRAVFSAAPLGAAIYEPTPAEQIGSKYDNEEFVITKLHHENLNGEWVSEGYTYKYRLEITGRMNHAAKNTPKHISIFLGNFFNSRRASKTARITTATIALRLKNSRNISQNVSAIANPPCMLFHRNNIFNSTITYSFVQIRLNIS